MTEISYTVELWQVYREFCLPTSPFCFLFILWPSLGSYSFISAPKLVTKFSGALRTQLWFLCWMLTPLFHPTEVGKNYQSFFLPFFFFSCYTLFQRKWVLETFTIVNHGLNSILVHLFNCCSAFSDSHPVLCCRENRGSCIVTWKYMKTIMYSSNLHKILILKSSLISVLKLKVTTHLIYCVPWILSHSFMIVSYNNW